MLGLASPISFLAILIVLCSYATINLWRLSATFGDLSAGESYLVSFWNSGNDWPAKTLVPKIIENLVFFVYFCSILGT